MPKKLVSEGKIINVPYPMTKKQRLATYQAEIKKASYN